MQAQSLVALAVIATLSYVTASPAMPYCGGSHSIPPVVNSTLKQVQVFIRHGDRTLASPHMCWKDQTAVFSCKNSQYQRNTIIESNTTTDVTRMYDLQFVPGREYLPGNCGVGELTSKGVEMQMGNGQALAAAYKSIGFLPAELEGHRDDFFLRSDDSDRTIKSGQALFDGLYPPSATGETEEVAWNTMDKSRDDIMGNPNICPGYLAAFAAAGQSPAVANFSKAHLAKGIELAKELGIPLSQFQFISLMDCAITHLCHDHPVPKVVSENMQYLLDTSTEQVALLFEQGKLNLYSVGPLIAEMWEYMQRVVNGESDYKFRLFSGHDLAPMFPLLIAYDVFDGVWPYYASLISMELYELDTGAWAVRMVYNGKVMHIPGCATELCTFDEFKSITEALIPTEAECPGMNGPIQPKGETVVFKRLRPKTLQDMTVEEKVAAMSSQFPPLTASST